MWRTKVCELLSIKYPILEGGMAIPGNGELAAAVSNAGGLGVVGMNPGWTPQEKQLENLRQHITRAKNLTDKPFGVNIPLFAGPNLGRSKESISLCVEEKVPVIVTSGGDPKLFTKYMKEAGVKVLHVALNVKQAKRAEEAGVDVVVASGVDAGGLLGAEEIPTFVLVPLVVDAVKVPVVAAGGIGDARGFVAALALGADGIQMGTRFLATTECHAHPAFKEAMLKTADRDVVITRRNSPPRVRSLRTNYVNHLEEMDRCGASAEEIRKFIGFGKAREALMLGDMTDGDPICGLSAAFVHEVISAGEVINNIVKDAEAILSRCSRIQTA